MAHGERTSGCEMASDKAEAIPELIIIEALRWADLNSKHSCFMAAALISISLFQIPTLVLVTACSQRHYVVAVPRLCLFIHKVFFFFKCVYVLLKFL